MKIVNQHFILILLFSLLIGWQLLRPGYYAMHDDLQVMRLYEMDRCFRNGQIPCRWAPDLVRGYGQPLFNYYSAFPYYLGEVVHLVGFSFVNTSKMLFLLSLFSSGVAVYLLAKEFMGQKASLIAALAYMTAPYHAVDIFVRGALAESWGLVFVPLALYAIITMTKRPSVNQAIILSLALAGLLTTHNITILMSFPLIIFFSLLSFLINKEKRKQFLLLLPGTIIGIGLSAFFLFPVLFEKSLIQSGFLTSDYFDFHAHFATISQLFTKLSWAYGPSRFNSYQYPETLSYFVGIIQIISILSAPVVLFLSRKEKKYHRWLFFILTFLLSLLALFMTHSRSVYLWDHLPALSFVQFPWRFLGPLVLLTSLLIGFELDYLVSKWSGSYLTIIPIMLLVTLNFSYFRFEKYFPGQKDSDKLTGSGYNQQIVGGLLDYLPLTNQKIPQTKAPDLPTIKSGRIDINYFDKRSNYFASEFDVYSEPAVVEFPVMYFPGWNVYQNRNGARIKFGLDNDYGLISVKLNKGHQIVQAFFEDTPIRQLSNTITYISSAILLFWYLINSSKKDEN